MPEILCSHCQHPLDAAAPRRGNMVSCTSCNGQVYVPQVQHHSARGEWVPPAARSNGGKKSHQPSRKPSIISSEGVGITLIVLCMFLAGGAVVAGGGYLVYYLNKKRLDAQEDRIKLEESEALAREKAAEEEAKARLLVDPLYPSGQDIRAMRRANQALSVASREAEEQYNGELKLAGFHRLLTPDRLAADKDFSQSRTILRATREAFNKHRAKDKSLLDKFVADLDAIQYESVPKHILMARIRASRASIQTDYDVIWNLKAEVFDRYEQAVTHLEKTQGKWTLEGANLAFNDVNDAEQYAKFFNEVDELTRKIEDKSQGMLDDIADDDFANDFDQ
jgi:hypothetical protein